MCTVVLQPPCMGARSSLAVTSSLTCSDNMGVNTTLNNMGVNTTLNNMGVNTTHNNYLIYRVLQA